MPSRTIVHESWLVYSHCRRHFQHLVSAFIDVFCRRRGHLPGGLWCPHWPDGGDFRELGASIGSQYSRRNSFDREVLKFGGPPKFVQEIKSLFNHSADFFVDLALN
jgi:hypothetical protein